MGQSKSVKGERTLDLFLLTYSEGRATLSAQTMGLQ